MTADRGRKGIDPTDPTDCGHGLGLGGPGAGRGGPDPEDDIPEEPDGSHAVAMPPAAAGGALGALITRSGTDVFVPDEIEAAPAFARTTDLGVGAHPDDLELLMVVPIGACHGEPDRWFAGVTCTDGAGSARAYAEVDDNQLVAIRRAEQRAAATVGAYGAVVQLGHASAAIRARSGHDLLVADLITLVRATRPVNIYTHNLADKHTTHVTVAAAVISALRSLAPAERPARVVGVEGWRDLDWLDDAEKVVLDATPFAELADRLAACFPSQIEGGKRYDLAAAGRRRANATMLAPRDADAAEQVSVAIDLTPLVRNDDLDPVAFTAAAIDRFREDVVAGVRRAFRPT